MPRAQRAPETATAEPLPAEPKAPSGNGTPPPVQVVERRIETVTVKIPLGEPPRRFDQVHVEGWLRRDEAHTFARLRQALRDQDARIADGRPVQSAADILRWLMANIHKAG